MTISSTLQWIKKLQNHILKYKNSQIPKWVTMKVHDAQNTNREISIF